ncbi:MAG: hemerythrin domain-containing protein [Ectobacillus sp.]
MKVKHCVQFPARHCPALEQLMQEHRMLVVQKEALLHLAAPIERGEDISYEEVLLCLCYKVQEFYKSFMKHTAKEEAFLYPLLAKCLGTEAGPVAVMELEHEQVAFHLTTFLNHAKNACDPIPKAEAKSLVYHLAEMADILNGHFEKEETIIFPLAEQLLTEEDKADIEKCIKHS